MVNSLPEVVHEFPPIIDKIKAVLTIPEKGVLFTYKGKVYAPDTENVPTELLVHENVHIVQQGEDSDGWWDKYLTDKSFRLLQELEAYATQYLFVKLRTTAKQYEPYLDTLCEIVSSEMYGGLINASQAKTRLRLLAKQIQEFAENNQKNNPEGGTVVNEPHL